WNANVLVLGDFNTDRIDDPLYEAFLSTGLFPPTQLRDVPRTIFHGDKSGNFYDQIAWFSTPEGADMLHGLSYANRAGGFNFLDHVYSGLTPGQVSWRISDHLPLWAGFTTAVTA